MECLILHKDHVSNFKTSNKVLNRRAQIATSSPDILNKGDVVWVDAECFGQPPIVKLDAFVLEEVVLIRLVKHLDAEHDKPGVMPPSQTNIVQVVESRAELRANQWVGGRVQLTRHTVWLETENSGSHIVNIVAPTCDNRVPFDGGARDPSTGQTLLEAYFDRKKRVRSN